MVVLKYIGSAIKDYVSSVTNFKVLTKDGILKTDGSFIYKFKNTNDDYLKPNFDASQSIGCLIPSKKTNENFIIYYVDNEDYINYLYLTEYDELNNDYKIENVNTNIKAIKNKSLFYYKDNNNVEWIYFQSNVPTKSFSRLNVATGIAEFVTDVDFGSVIQFDEHSGYGIFNVNSESKINNEIILKSFIKEQAINVPNNFYISALAMKLAMAYKIKQNADVSNLISQYDEMLNNFYNSISNDSWNNYRINNAY